MVKVVLHCSDSSFGNAALIGNTDYQSKRLIKISTYDCVPAFTIVISKMLYQSFCYTIGISGIHYRQRK